MRTEEKKRGALIAKAAKDTPPETPIEAAPPAQFSEVTQEFSTDAVAQPNGPEDHGPQAVQDGETEAEGGSQIKEEPTTDNPMAIIPAHTHSDHEIGRAHV